MTLLTSDPKMTSAAELTESLQKAIQHMESNPNICSPYYSWPSTTRQQLDLNGTWKISHNYLPADPNGPAGEETVAGAEWFAGEVPSMVQWQWYRTGKGPHPYKGMNSNEYVWMEERAWWFWRRA